MATGIKIYQIDIPTLFVIVKIDTKKKKTDRSIRTILTQTHTYFMPILDLG